MSKITSQPLEIYLVSKVSPSLQDPKAGTVEAADSFFSLLTLYSLKVITGFGIIVD